MRTASNLSNIGRLLTSGVFAVPAYQRDFVWTVKDVETLLNDVLQARANNQNHFIGLIVVMAADDDFRATSAQGDYRLVQKRLNDKNVYHIIDGQQRITACSLILCALYELLSEEDDELFDSNVRGPRNKQYLLQKLYDYLCDTDVDIDGLFFPRLLLNNDVSQQYQACLPDRRKGNPAGWRLKNIYTKIKVELKKHKESETDVPAFYHEVTQALTNRLLVDDVSCDDFESAFQIFESINAKGQPLTSADLIKCFLIKQASNSNPSEAERQWNKLLETVGVASDKTTDLDRFMGVFLFTECGHRVAKVNAYKEFKEAFGSKSYQEIFDSLQTAAEMYSTLVKGGENNRWKDNRSLEAFRVLNLSTFYVPILAAARFSEKGLDSKLVDELIQQLSGFALRYLICGKTSNLLDRPFATMIEKIKAGDSIDTIMYELKRLKPQDEEFFVEFASQTFRDSEEPLAIYLLCRLEEFRALANDGSVKQLPGVYSLEHIVPKEYYAFVKEWNHPEPENFKEEYVRHIGNLALIGLSENTAAKNKPYSEKLIIYKEGSQSGMTTPIADYQLLRELVDDYPESFTEKDILERAQKLARYAVAFWA